MYFYTTYGRINVTEQIYDLKGFKKCIRPFSERVGIFCRRYSRSLERAVTDFGSDHSFGQVTMKMQEHYGIDVPTSSARLITGKHAHHLFVQEDLRDSRLPKASAQSMILAETDGSMIPLVHHKERPEGAIKFDRRKAKEHLWREARLSFARSLTSVTPTFGATLGKPEAVGRQLVTVVEQVGFDEETKIHFLGDGAPWIANQVEEKFGVQATYLVDFYHVCEYLGEAAPFCGNNAKEWLQTQKDCLKSGLLESVLSALRPYIEGEKVQEAQAPVRRCYRYLDKRRDQLDYKTAIQNGLPIGSGEIESAHRYVVQKRLKIPGAWWKEVNAADMLALRVNRANGNWNQYWITKKAA